MSLPESAPCEFLPWDTEFFGCRIARVRGEVMTPEQGAEADDWCRSNGVRCLYFLSRADDPETVQTAEQHGFGLVDVRVTFERALGRAAGPAGREQVSAISVRHAQPGDLAGLEAIARTAHTATRFFNDRHFPRPVVENFYATWVASEVQGRAQAVLVAATPAGQAVGYLSCHLDPVLRRGSIGLVGVGEGVRGQGVGRSLVLRAVDWFGTQQAREVTVVTQGNNRAAQRLYQRCGFLSRDLQLWYHKWFPPPHEGAS